MYPRFMLRAVLLAWTAGFVLGESGPPHEAAAPAFVFGAALQLALGELVERRQAARAFFVGLSSGIGFGCSALAWIAPAVSSFSPSHAHLAWPATAAAVVLSALAPALGAMLYVLCARGRAGALRFSASMALAFAAVPMLFPYRPIAMAFPFLPAAAWLSVGGPALADLLVLLPGGILVEAWQESEPARALRGLGLLACMLLLGGIETTRVESARASAKVVRAGIVQSDVDIAEGRDRARRMPRLERLRAHTEALADAELDVVLWPESSFPFAVDRASLRELPAPRHVGAHRANATVVVGAGTSAGRCEHWNSVVVYDRDGNVAGMVDKARRMPFADASPWSLLFRPRESACGELSPARRAELLPRTEGAGAMICYDEVEPWVARERVAAGAAYLVGFTNDAWYEGTRQPVLHERIARMRAVEAGRDLVRVVNGGPSALIASSGRFVARIDEGREETRVVDVRAQSGRTLYALVGPFVEWLLLFGVVAFGVQRRRTSSSGGGR